MFKKIVKRDGKVATFKPEKIADAIASAGLATEEFKQDRAKALTEKVLKRAEETIHQRTPNVEQIQDIVEQVLMESAFKRTAKEYITYRQERNRIREFQYHDATRTRMIFSEHSRCCQTVRK